MLKFNEQVYMEREKDVLGLKCDIEMIADQISQNGYKNLFLIGVGATLSYGWQMESIMKSISSIDCYVDNAAEFVALGNKHFSKDTIMLIVSASGDTQEIMDAADYAKEIGAKIVGFIDKKGTPLCEVADYLISAGSFCSETFLDLIYYQLYIFIMRLLYNANDFARYDKFIKELGSLPEALLDVRKSTDKLAEAYSEKHKDDMLQYLVGSGNLWGPTYCYAMCIMEEMQWMRTKSIHASEFFHGTLEVIERDTSVTLFIGEDATRPLMERVNKFLSRICSNVTAFDTKSFKMKGISMEFRSILSPFVMSAICERINAHLEDKRKHPMEIRRYYRRLSY